MATTTNYGWTTPDDTALVKDGAAAIRTLGSSVDTTTKNLNPETTLGDLAYRSSTANVNTRLALGTANQQLRVNSGATAPEWFTPAVVSSGMTLITTLNPSGVGTVNANSVFSATYNSYYISFYVTQAANAGISMRLRNSGTDETGSTYTLNGVVGGLGSAATSWGLGPNVASGNRYVGNVWVNKPFLAEETDGWYLMGYSAGGTAGAYSMHNSVASSFDGFSIIQGSGNFSGQICVYGLAK